MGSTYNSFDPTIVKMNKVPILKTRRLRSGCLMEILCGPEDNVTIFHYSDFGRL